MYRIHNRDYIPSRRIHSSVYRQLFCSTVLRQKRESVHSAQYTIMCYSHIYLNDMVLMQVDIEEYCITGRDTVLSGKILPYFLSNAPLIFRIVFALLPSLYGQKLVLERR